MATEPRIIDSRHPSFTSNMADWDKWRLTYRGGDEFCDRYLQEYSNREDHLDFVSRKKNTPIPAFAKSAVNDIRNAIFQRMRDIVRVSGSEGYMKAVNGLDLGVDRRGSTMNAFLGMKCLTELLVMGRCGVFVDNSVISGESLADAMGTRPYLYPYQVEDILSWSCSKPEAPSEFQSVLLRDTCMDYDRATMLPLQTFVRYRLLWINQDTGNVNLQFYDTKGIPVDRDGNPSGAIELELRRIPFVLMDIGDSLIKDVCQQQIAMLNLGSSDVNYCLKSSFPFYVEMRDRRAIGGHLKQAANPDGTATVGGQTSHDAEVRVGTTQGRFYDVGTDRPSFINPSSEPLKASLELQAKLEEDIRKLVNLAVVSLASRASAESKSLDNQGLEAGLSYIGLVLENGERQIAEFWAGYEERNPANRTVAVIKYPDRYSLKDDSDRIEEAVKLSKLMFSLPGRTVKREIAKVCVGSLLSGKIGVDVIDKITKEIDNAEYLTSDPDTIVAAVENGLVGDRIGSIALGFPDDEYKVAQKDHAARAERIASAQASGAAEGDPAARGLNDLSADPKAGSKEKARSSDPTLQPDRKPAVRGKAAGSRVTGSSAD